MNWMSGELDRSSGSREGEQLEERPERVQFNSERGEQQEGRGELEPMSPRKGARDKGQRGGHRGQLHVARAEHVARWKKEKMTDGAKKG